MAVRRILILSPQVDMRRSLEFALEAEGFAVTARSRVDLGQAPAGGPFDCIVVDHQALNGPHDRVIAFCARSAPIVLLSTRTMPWLQPHVAKLVQKPLGIGHVAEAVREVIERDSERPTQEA